MREIHVVGAAILEGSRVLAARRSADMHPPLKWEFAGGKVEDGESYEQALKREILEELGVDIRVGPPVAVGVSETGGRRVVLHVYEAGIIEGKPVPKEHSTLEWVEISRLSGLDWADADIPACRELERRYVRHSGKHIQLL